MSNNKYIGITIGPIYKTLQKAQKTREIWGASYLFSYICKEILKKINTDNYEILLPNPQNINCENQGVGLFPDRILLKVKNHESGLNEINKYAKEVKEHLTEELWEELDKPNFSFKPYEWHITKFKKKEQELRAFFFDYFKIYAIEAAEEQLNFTNEHGEKIGIIKSLNLYLDNAEQMPTMAHTDPDPFFAILHFTNHSFLAKDAFHEDYKNGFPSIAEIATNELQFVKNSNKQYLAREEIREIIKEDFDKLRKENRDNNSCSEDTKNPAHEDDEEMLAKIFEIEPIKGHLRNYHKYIAIVHTDGDNMGKLIGSLKDDIEAIDQFSKDLVDFNIEANKILAGKKFTENSKNNWGYGAAPVYIGGDDLVFFAPVASINGKGEYKTIFDLIHELDESFNEIFNTKETDGSFTKYKSLTESRPSLTYGVSITYYKFPLREAYEQSCNLMYEAKSSKYKTRNRINLTLQKHSRQNYSCIIDKNFPNTFEKYRKLLSASIEKAPTGEKSEKFLNSIKRNILASEGQYLDKSVPDLEHLFENNFNEQIHKDYKGYLKDIKDWMQEMLENQDYQKNYIVYEKETLNSIISLLELIHFFRDNELRN